MAGYTIPFAIPQWTYEESLNRLHQALRFGICPLLEMVCDMLAELGDPDLCYGVLQVAGTNGKTSTSRYAAAILRGEGLCTALYTSPELVSYTERMEVDGSPVSEEAFARGIAAASVAGERMNERRERMGERAYDITEFDLLTVAACVIYAEAGVDVVVFEVGMGGRWDATSAVKSIRSVAVTGIGLDHMRFLGDTLEEIAGEKAAVIQAGRTCVLGVGTATPDSVEDVFLQRCEAVGVKPVLLRPVNLADASGEMHPGIPREHEDLPSATYRVTKHPHHLGSPLELTVTTPSSCYRGLEAYKPAYQAANIACAVALCEGYLGRPLDEAALHESVLACPTPGRFDLLRTDPLVIIDACHNPQSVETFLTAVRAMEPEVEKRPALLCAALSDKDCGSMVKLLAHEFPRVYVTQTSSPRALAATELAKLFSAEGANVLSVYPNVPQAVQALDDTAYVACGSITLAGEVAGLFRA